MWSISSLQCAAALSCGVFGFDSTLFAFDNHETASEGKGLEKALAHEDSMAQSAEQTLQSRFRGEGIKSHLYF